MNTNLPILNRAHPIGSKADPSLPERILQIGEGNFLRGYLDWMIYKMNQNGYFSGRVVAIQPTPRGKVVPVLNQQDGLYTLILRGLEQGKPVEQMEVIDSISRGINPYENWQAARQVAEAPEIKFVFSNTTEAGLTFMEESFDPHQSPLSFPGKLVALLYHRYQHFQGACGKGWTIIPCELVDKNGEVLRELCFRMASYWHLPNDFLDWIKRECHFCNTLVDRIVTGYPHEEATAFAARLGFRDSLMTVAEPYHLLVIEGPDQLPEQLPLVKAGLHVYFDQIDQYRECKVKLLNAPHTLLAAVAFLAGIDTVKEAVEDSQIHAYLLDAMLQELGVTVEGVSPQQVRQYTKEVIERFANPYIQHQLHDISLNAISKFTTRVLPSIHSYQAKKGMLPKALVFGLAALISFYQPIYKDGKGWIGHRGYDEYEIRDNTEIIEEMSRLWEVFDGTQISLERLVASVLSKSNLWGVELHQHDNLVIQTAHYLFAIHQYGIRKALTELGDS